MDASGRQAIWASKIHSLFGKEFFEHVVYYDSVGCSFSGAIQFVIITETDLYIYPMNSKKRPEPFCTLLSIQEVDCDHEVPETYLNVPEYDPHRIIIKVGGLYHALYTFEAKSDLFWNLSHSVEMAKRRAFEQVSSIQTKGARQILTTTIDGKTTTLLSKYVDNFNKLSSHIMHDPTHEERMKALDEINSLAQKYFPIRSVFFQSTCLIQYLVDTVSFFSDINTIPKQVKTTRVQQIAFIRAIFETFSNYLRGSQSIRETFRLITMNNGDQYKALIQAMFTVEFFVLSQPSREKFYLKKVDDIDSFHFELQGIAMAVPTLCYQLYLLGNLAAREKILEKRDYLLDILSERIDAVISGGFHAIVYLAIQMGHLVQADIRLDDQFAFSLMDHLWFIDIMTRTFPKALKFLKDNFEIEFEVVMTESRLRQENLGNFPMVDVIQKSVASIKKSLKSLNNSDTDGKGLPVQFR